MNNCRNNANQSDSLYDCWLKYDLNNNINDYSALRKYCGVICVSGNNEVLASAAEELSLAITRMTGAAPEISSAATAVPHFRIGTIAALPADGYSVTRSENEISILGGTPTGALYGTFRFLILACGGAPIDECCVTESPVYSLRMINHWDNADGSIERGYSGNSIFFADNEFIGDLDRIKDYARMLSSVGINGLTINNVNVHKTETFFITDKFLGDVAKTAAVFRNYGIKLYLSINYAAPVELGGLENADPLNPDVKRWWSETAAHIYKIIPDFGGFLVKADSENRPGPFTYGRNHADGANMLAEAVAPYGGNIIWRCFVYNCHVDWRDRTTDRARAAYDNFKPLDGKFLKNVYLQIKNGPMDFQIREATSPLFGAMPNTNCLAEFQIAQEYTGQQKDLCYLVPMWKECLDFNTKQNGDLTVSNAVSGIAGVSNIGNDKCWTGNPLAGANLYGYGRLIFNPSLSAEKIADEWIRSATSCDPSVVRTLADMLLPSRSIYENYTSPLGIGWMVNPGGHYGVSVDGYEYSAWGTYHYADRDGIGVDRTSATGTGFAAQYAPENAKMYESTATCPEELLLFFHHVPYTYTLKSGKTLIQHIYDTHFVGVVQVEELVEMWNGLETKLPEEFFSLVAERLQMQHKNSIEWRDVVNTYFYRKTGIDDNKGRIIYK